MTTILDLLKREAFVGGVGDLVPVFSRCEGAQRSEEEALEELSKLEFPNGMAQLVELGPDEFIRKLSTSGGLTEVVTRAAMSLVFATEEQLEDILSGREL